MQLNTHTQNYKGLLRQISGNKGSEIISISTI